MTTINYTHNESGSGVTPFRNEPPLDFSKTAVRAEFMRALERARESFPILAPVVIGGERGQGGGSIRVASPNDTSLVVGECAEGTEKDADRAVAAARKAFARWSATEPGERAAILMRVAAACRKRRIELAALEVFEAGKPWREADADVTEAIDFMEFYAREMLRLGCPVALQREILGERNELSYHPLGVVAVIGPWNFPMAIPVGMMSAAMVAGNCVVWKPAEQTPLITWRVMEIMESCGVPRGVVNFLPGRGEVVGQRIVAHRDVDMVVFTGSKDVGLRIVRACGEVAEGQHHVKRVITEMGGKNALIVDSSADLDAAVPDILASAFGFTGQKCSALSRLIVVDDVYEALLPRLKEGIASLKIAPSWDPGCQVGPLIDAEARAKSERYRAVGREEGRVVFEADAGELADRGHFVGPAAYEVDSGNARLAREEVFGPVLAILRARDFEHGLAMANDCEYALTGGVHSRSLEHLERARRAMRCGNLYLNRTITGAMVGRHPFGGFKLSGIGSKTGGPDYLLQFLVARACSENLMRHGFAPLDG